MARRPVALWSAGVAGSISCAVTHAIVVPLDCIKTTLQTQPELTGNRVAARTILETSGPRGFLRGLGPTAIGYSVQGLIKFGGYETLKRAGNRLIARARPDDERTPPLLRISMMLAAAGSAELAATLFLCPLETVKLRMQTDAAVASLGVARAVGHIVRSEGAAALYVGLGPIALRQVPYTMVKLVAYDALILAIRRGRAGPVAAGRQPCDAPAARGPFSASVSSARDLAASHGRQPKCDGDEMSAARLAASSLAAGLLAGCAAAVVSQPADVLLTRTCSNAAGARP